MKVRSARRLPALWPAYPLVLGGVVAALLSAVGIVAVSWVVTYSMGGPV